MSNARSIVGTYASKPKPHPVSFVPNKQDAAHDVVLNGLKVGSIVYNKKHRVWQATWRGEQWEAGSLAAAQVMMRTRHWYEVRQAAATPPAGQSARPLFAGRRWLAWLLSKRKR